MILNSTSLIFSWPANFLRLSDQGVGVVRLAYSYSQVIGEPAVGDGFHEDTVVLQVALDVVAWPRVTWHSRKLAPDE